MRRGEHGEKIYMRSIQVRGEVGVQASVREAREHSRRTACEARDAREERRRVIIIYTRAARCTRRRTIGGESRARLENFQRQVLRRQRPRCESDRSRRTFRQKKHRLLANMKRLYQRSF